MAERTLGHSAHRLICSLPNNLEDSSLACTDGLRASRATIGRVAAARREPWLPADDAQEKTHGTHTVGRPVSVLRTGGIGLSQSRNDGRGLPWLRHDVRGGRGRRLLDLDRRRRTIRAAPALPRPVVKGGTMRLTIGVTKK